MPSDFALGPLPLPTQQQQQLVIDFSLRPLPCPSQQHHNHRFFNALLKGVYDSCILPTETAFAAHNAVLSSTYRLQLESSSSALTWTHNTYLPPPSPMNVNPPLPRLSQPFAQPSKPQLQCSRNRKRKHSADDDDDDDDMPKEDNPYLRTFKVRLRLNPEQRSEIIKAIAVQRAAFNFAADLVNNYGAEPSFYSLRAAWFGWKQEIRDNAFPGAEKHKWLLDAQCNTRVDARGIRAFTMAACKEKEKAKKKGKAASRVRFRNTKKLISEVLVLEKASTGGPLQRFLPVPYVSRKGHAACVVKLGGVQFSQHTSKDLQYLLLEDTPKVIAQLVQEKNPLFDASIIWNKRLDSFHLSYVFELPRLNDPDPHFLHKRIVATDPGVYPFQAWYSPTSGQHGRLLAGCANNELMQKNSRIDALQSKLDCHGSLSEAQVRSLDAMPMLTQFERKRMRRRRYKIRHRLRRRLARERERLKGWIRAAHYDCANFLLRNHDLVLQPELQVSRLSQRQKRNIGIKTIRTMLTWSHYLFRKRLQTSAYRYAGRHVRICTEPGTSKTCTQCGFWNAGLLVRDKIYHCPRCHISVDRQLAGARNNFFAAYGIAVGMGWDGIDG